MEPEPSESGNGGVDSIAVRRGRREKKKSVASAALEKIKRSRETGLHEESELETPQALFDYVDDNEYARIVQQRQEEGFVMDDDGSYCEHGREIFDEEVDQSKKSTDKNKSSKPGGPKRVAKPSSNIKHMLMSRVDSSKKRKKEEKVSVKGDPLLDNLLLQIGPSNSSAAPRKLRTDTPTSSKSSQRTTTPQFTPRQSSTPSASKQSASSKIRIVKSHERTTNKFTKLPKPTIPRMELDEAPVEDDYDNDGFGDMDWDNGQDDFGGAVSEVCGGEEPKSERKECEVGGGVEKVMEEDISERTEVPQEAISTTGWETIREGLEETQEAFSGVQLASSSLPTKEIEGEEVLVFFWLDAYEDYYRHPGTVYLFGKVWAQEAKAYVSCCIVVKNIERCLYFLPREKIANKAGKPTDKDVTFEDLYMEFNAKYAEKFNISRFTSKRVTKKYAFDKPDVPPESEFLEVRYSTDYPAPPMNASGQTFSHVFGTNTSSLERLVLKCNLKGPCWLHIKQPVCHQQAISWCKCEAVVNSMSCIAVATEQAPPPPLVVMSLSLKITLNPRTGTNEVLSLGSLVHPSVCFDKPAPKTPFQADLCAIRRPIDRDFPFRFEEFVKKKGFNVEISPSERAMLAYFLAKLHRADPDIIVGHNLSSYALEVLQHRMAACKVPQWSRVGRIKRKDMPKGRMVGQLLCAGRPVCDVRISAQELIRAKSYDLSELANTVLHEHHRDMSHEDILRAFCSCEHLGGIITHIMNEAMLSLRLMYELNVLPLAYQITCIAGNILSRTLMGGRAERNEFLLLHAFTAKDFICPDKQYGKKTTSVEHSAVTEGEEQTGSGRGRRKPAYSGGLVLEPKRGFYDRYILLLDFNSLYPSIIQEYNICFTTVDHAHCPLDDEGYSRLRLPDPSEAAGILPSEIRVLVERRRQVKKLMKGAQGNPEQYVQYDIRQKALKLTANSMYGCLGFANSRFYAKPLAAIVTGKGREILAHTKELTEKMNLSVIYGDTDSIMVDSMISSKSGDIKEAEKIAQRVKSEVNKSYRLLEIDIDGIFKSMLLLKKKKYAAVAVEMRDGKLFAHTELKGLDIVRRDWCELAKESGHRVLDSILSGDPLDEVIDRVQKYLVELKDQIHGGHIDLKKYVITKSLTKPPKDYPDKKSLAHVQVALRMQSRNVHVQAGDVIPYVVCKGDTNQSMSQRSFHPEEMMAQTHLEVDRLYYLQHQVHAVVSRLCEPIEGLSAAHLAECLGLDPSSYRSSSTAYDEEDGVEGMGRSARGQDVFQDTDPLMVTCGNCKNLVQVSGSQCTTNYSEGLSCVDCKKPLGTRRIMNHLTLTIRAYIKKYYSGWLTCEDQSCQFRTRNTSICLEDSAPVCPNCRHGKLKEEFSATALYRQLSAFDMLFSPNEGGKTFGAGGGHGSENDYKIIKAHVGGYLQQNQYSKINLERLFPDLSA